MKTITIKLNLEIEVEVSGNYQKEVQGTFYTSNGDPGNPPEPAQFDISKVMWQGIDIAPMLDAEGFDFAQIEEDCLTKIDFLNKDLYSNYDF